MITLLYTKSKCKSFAFAADDSMSFNWYMKGWNHYEKK